MGMLVEGRWVDDAGQIIKDGIFVRAESTLDHEIPQAVIDEIAAASGRYALVASFSCPWSHRALLARTLKGLDAKLPLCHATGPRIEGYGVWDDGLLSGGPGTGYVHLHQLYAATDAQITCRATVPLIWDRDNQKIVSNGSHQIMRGLDRTDAPGGFTLAPPELTDDIDALNTRIYDGLANAVYRAGMARSQSAYDEAVAAVFATLFWLEERLGGQRYLLGRTIAETDWRLFATLVRFDAVYATHFRCTRRRLVDHANLWAYARDLFSWRRVRKTIDFKVNHEGYYLNDGDHNPHGIIADLPEIDWAAPHGRDSFGPAQIWSRQQGPVDVEPASFDAAES